MIEKRDVSDKGESPHQIDVHRCGNQHSADFRETVDVRCVYRSQPSGAGERENLKKDRSTDLSGSHEIPDQYQRACHCPYIIKVLYFTNLILIFLRPFTSIC